MNAVEHLRALCPQTRIIWCSDLDFSLHAFRLRADYFLLEPVTEAALRQGFRIWLDGKIRRSSTGLTATNTTRRTVYEKEKHRPFCVKPVADRSIVPFHGCLRRNTDAGRQCCRFAARCPVRCGTALFSGTSLCGAAGKGSEPQAGRGKPLHGQERCKHSSRWYNTDSTDEILPLAIYPEINVSYETTNANASPAIYLTATSCRCAAAGRIAIRDLNAEETKTLGYFSPKKHDAAVTLSRAPIPSLTNPTASSAPPATTMC